MSKLIIAVMLITVLGGCSGGDKSLDALKKLRDRCPVEGTITEALTIGGNFNSSFMVSCSYIKPPPK